MLNNLNKPTYTHTYARIQSNYYAWCHFLLIKRYILKSVMFYYYCVSKISNGKVNIVLSLLFSVEDKQRMNQALRVNLII